ncbi:hypothetical protein ACIQZO_39850 [Streptomyces sp. NPDC097617]|uniref:hypothetical protein n=1 Tax=Streptomyces sp. NPDC097617 TaxID=3366091 RepID=UPI0038151F7D
MPSEVQGALVLGSAWAAWTVSSSPAVPYDGFLPAYDRMISLLNRKNLILSKSPTCFTLAADQCGSVQAVHRTGSVVNFQCTTHQANRVLPGVVASNAQDLWIGSGKARGGRTFPHDPLKVSE